MPKDALAEEIKKFSDFLREKFKKEISENPGKFRSVVVGRLRGYLPRGKPGRKPHEETLIAVKIYKDRYQSNGSEGNWHKIAREVFPNYQKESLQVQKLLRYELRANVHSFLYDERSRELRGVKKTLETKQLEELLSLDSVK